jgi:hypothetical protein
MAKYICTRMVKCNGRAGGVYLEGDDYKGPKELIAELEACGAIKVKGRKGPTTAKAAAGKEAERIAAAAKAGAPAQTDLEDAAEAAAEAAAEDQRAMAHALGQPNGAGMLTGEGPAS